jgi:tetratricopeptide (TPR) repeat protein
VVLSSIETGKQRKLQARLPLLFRMPNIEPRYIAARIGKDDTEMDMYMPEEAIASYEQALTYDQNSFQAWNGLGNARSFLRDYAGAVDA